MNTLIHADIFFFVTTIAVILLVSLLAIVIIYIARILSDVRYITGVVRKETDSFAEDLREAREKLKNDGLFGGFFTLITRLFKGRAGKVERSKSKRK